MPSLLSNHDANLVPLEEWTSRRAEQNTTRDVDDRPELTEEEAAEYEIVRRVCTLIGDAQEARAPYENFEACWRLYTGDIYPQKWPNYRSRITINRVRAIVTFMAAVMTDNKPRFSVDPLVPGSETAADLLRRRLDAHWDTGDLQRKQMLFVLYGLIWGTGFWKLGYDPYAAGGRGKHLDDVVPPYRMYTNRTASCIEDAPYLIQVGEVPFSWIKEHYPQRAEAVWQVRGLAIEGGNANDRDRQRDYIRDGDSSQLPYRIVSAQNINGNITPPMASRPNPEWEAGDDDSVQIAEAWIRDVQWEPAQRQKMVNGVPQTKPVLDDEGLTVFEVVGQQTVVSEIDGQPVSLPLRKAKTEPVMESYWREKYPNGRIVLLAAGRVLLVDTPNQLQTDGPYWSMWKDYDVGAFWGQGESIALKDAAIATNRIVSEVFDILEKIGRPQYKMSKTAGVNANTIKSKAGSILVMDDIKAIEPLGKPDIPPQFLELYKVLKESMGEVSGVNEAVMGATPGDKSYAAIDQLQESGSAIIRAKVRNMESGLTRVGRLRLQLIQQFDAVTTAGVLREQPNEMRMPSPESGEGEAQGDTGYYATVVEPASNVSARFQYYSNADLQGQVEFSVVPISSMASSPSGLWNKWLSLYDKHIVDRRWFLSKFRIEGYRTELPRMEKQERLDAQMQAAAKDKSKPGPAPKSPPSRAHRGKQHPPAMSSNAPTAFANAQLR